MATKPRRARRQPTTQQRGLAEAISGVQKTLDDPSPRVRDKAVRALGEALAPLLSREATRLARETGVDLRDAEAEMLAAAWEASLAFDESKGVYPAHYMGSRYGKLPSARITATRRHQRWRERHHFVDQDGLEALANESGEG